MTEKAMTVEEALGWCARYMVTVQFHKVYGGERVTVRCPGGLPMEERDTFVQAVEATARQQRRKERLEAGLNPWEEER